LQEQSIDISAVDHLDDTTNDPTLDPTLDHTGDGLTYPAPEFEDELPIDTTADQTANAAIFEEDEFDPNFGRETPLDTSRQERVEDITLDSLEPLASKSAAAKGSSSFSLHRKRKLIIDSKIEISSEAMRAGLEQDGPDDITRQPCVSFAKTNKHSCPRSHLALGPMECALKPWRWWSCPHRMCGFVPISAAVWYLRCSGCSHLGTRHDRAHPCLSVGMV
jgi:hypothetical protein